MRRGPHAEWPGSVFFIDAVMRIFCCRNARAGRSTIVGVRFEGDSPVVEEFKWLLGLAAGCGLWRGPALVTTAQSWRLVFSFSPRWWWCSVVLCAFVCVVYASARYVRIFFYMTEQCSCYYLKKMNVPCKTREGENCTWTGRIDKGATEPSWSISGSSGECGPVQRSTTS